MITFQLETWKQFFADAPKLWERLWGEFGEKFKSEPGQEKMEPDTDAYDRLDQFGRLLIVTARDDGKLIGYATSAIQQHPHFTSTKVGFGDTNYLDPAYRKGMTGVKLFRMTEKIMKELKVQRYFLPVPEVGGFEIIAKRLGFKPEHTIYSKWIGD
jgi:hypothetical protein